MASRVASDGSGRDLRRPGAAELQSLRYAEDIRRLYRQLQRAICQSLLGLANALEAKDPYTRGHSERVGAWGRRLATALGLAARRRRDGRAGRAAARHRQDRDPGDRAAQARPARHGGVGADAQSSDHRRPDRRAVRVLRGRRPRHPSPPRALERHRLSRRAGRRRHSARRSHRRGGRRLRRADLRPPVPRRPAARRRRSRISSARLAGRWTPTSWPRCSGSCGSTPATPPEARRVRPGASARPSSERAARPTRRGAHGGARIGVAGVTILSVAGLVPRAAVGIAGLAGRARRRCSASALAWTSTGERRDRQAPLEAALLLGRRGRGRSAAGGWLAYLVLPGVAGVPPAGLGRRRCGAAGRGGGRRRALRPRSGRPLARERVADASDHRVRFGPAGELAAWWAYDLGANVALGRGVLPGRALRACAPPVGLSRRGRAVGSRARSHAISSTRSCRTRPKWWPGAAFYLALLGSRQLLAAGAHGQPAAAVRRRVGLLCGVPTARAALSGERRDRPRGGARARADHGRARAGRRPRGLALAARVPRAGRGRGASPTAAAAFWSRSRPCCSTRRS